MVKLCADCSAAHIEHVDKVNFKRQSWSLCSQRECDDCGTNSTRDDRERRNLLRCSLCPPNQHENAKRKPKHGKAKPKGKGKHQ